MQSQNPSRPSSATSHLQNKHKSSQSSYILPLNDIAKNTPRHTGTPRPHVITSATSHGIMPHHMKPRDVTARISLRTHDVISTGRVTSLAPHGMRRSRRILYKGDAARRTSRTVWSVERAGAVKTGPARMRRRAGGALSCRHCEMRNISALRGTAGVFLQAFYTLGCNAEFNQSLFQQYGSSK